MVAALLVGISQYEDANFPPLAAAHQDVEAFQSILRHPEIGANRASNVRALSDPTLLQLQHAIASLCMNRRVDELTLIYISGYGVVDDLGHLYIPCRNTESNRLGQTGFSILELQAALEVCASQQQVIFLDCCFSGTFSKGMVSPADIDEIGQQLGSDRRAFFSSPWSIDYSPSHKSRNLSSYTQYLLDGLGTGMADGVANCPMNGEISVLELHDYIFNRMEENLPALVPKLYTQGLGYNLVVCRAPYPEFRCEVRGLSARGDISLVGKSILEELRLKLGIPPEIANAIQKDALRGSQLQNEKRRQYERIQAEISQQEVPLSDNTRVELMRLREIYKLSDETPTDHQPPDRGLERDLAAAVTQPPLDTDLASIWESEVRRLPDAMEAPFTPAIGSQGFAATATTSPPLSTEIPFPEEAATTHAFFEPESFASDTARPRSAVAFTPEAELPPTTLEAEPPSDRHRSTIDRPGTLPEAVDDLDEEESDSGLRQRLQEFFSRQNSGAGFDPLQIGIASLLIVGLLGSIFWWVAFQPIRSSSNSVTNLKFSTAAEYFSEAIARSRKGDREGAIAAYSEAIDLDPKKPNAYYNRGVEYSRRNDKNQAIKDFTDAIRLDQTFADAYYNRGNAHAATGDRQSALKDYQQAVRLYQEQGAVNNRTNAQNMLRKLQDRGR